MDEERFMSHLQDRLMELVESDAGCGPFYAAVVDRDGNVVSECANSVVSSGISHAHAEMNAISAAEKKLGTWNLAGKGLTLFTTAEPCMMCIGGILWSGIEKVVYGVSTQSVERLTGFDEGFKPSWRDEFERRGISVSGPILEPKGEAVLKRYVERQGVIYSPRP